MASTCISINGKWDTNAHGASEKGFATSQEGRISLILHRYVIHVMFQVTVSEVRFSVPLAVLNTGCKYINRGFCRHRSLLLTNAACEIMPRSYSTTENASGVCVVH